MLKIVKIKTTHILRQRESDGFVVARKWSSTGTTKRVGIKSIWSSRLRRINCSRK